MRLKNFILVPVTITLVLSSVNQASAQIIQPNALRQIQSLIDEKESRTPAQKKLDSQLWYAIKEDNGQPITSLVATLEVNVRKDNSGRVPVDIRGNVTNALIKAINDAGGEIIFKSENFNTINARIPLLALEQIAALDDVRFIYPADRAYIHEDVKASGFTDPENKFFDNFFRMNGKPKLDALAIRGPKTFFNSYDSKHDSRNEATAPVKFDFSPAVTSHIDFATRAARVRKQLSNALSDKKFRPGLPPTGPINSQGDVTHRADAARAFFGVTGSGVKIGVLSDGVNSLAAQQGLGELPAVTVLPGQAGSGNEGTAMLEIIYDLAPGAQLFFATAFTSQASFAQNILDLRAAGCDIIVDDVAYFREAVFQDDNVALSVNTVTAAGALYFSSAGNEGNKDDNTSGVWEGDFLDAGTGTVGAVVLAGGTVHNFGGGVLNNQITTANGGAPIGLFWSDQLGTSGNDYDLYILDAGLTVVVNAATNVQDGNDDPVELSTISPGAGRRLVIFKKTAAAQRALHLNTFRGRLALNTTGQTHGHSSAVNAFSVAATPAAGAFGAPPNPTGPFPGVFNAANLTELFSSDGPRRMFYNPNGTAITPGNFLFGTGGGNVRQKPDITAADGTATGVAGFNPFYGTSAAAPHAAAIAGLVKSALPALTPAQIRTALTTSAIDIEAAGYDRDAGFGIVMAYEALLAAGAAPVPFIVSAGATLVSESCVPANGVIDPAETVTVSFCVQNTGGSNTANLVGTLQASGGVTSPSGPQNYGIVVAGGPVVCRNFTFTASGACGSTITASIQFQDGASNLGTITYTFTLGVLSNSTTTFSNATAITIPSSGAATPYPSNIVVSGLIGTVNKVTVNLTGLNHTFPEDVGMLLVGPGGQKFVILDGVIGGTAWVNINYTLDDAAATTIPKPGTPISGTFKPTDFFAGDVFPAPAPGGANLEPAPAGSATFASAFNGINPNGTWSLYVFDFAAGDAGSVSGGWSLNITTGTYTCCTPPSCTLTCPANIIQSNDPNQCGAVVTYPAPATSGTCGTVSTSPASGSFFPIGTTTVTATSSIGGGTCTFTITVNDTQAPSITCPANITLCGSQVVNYPAPTVTDNCPGPTYVSIPASGSIFPVGVTTVTATATDASGNTAVCTFTVTINPIPNAVATPSSQTVCSGVPITTIVLSGAVGGTTYNWTRNNTVTVTGIAASGSGNISGTLTNTTNAPVTVTFTITPTASGCAGTPITATVLVNPTPNAAVVVIPGTLQVIITGDGSWADEITWTLRNSLNAIILSGGPYGFNPPPTPSGTAPAANAPFSFFIEAQGAFNDNSCLWEVRCNGIVVSSGCIRGTANPGPSVCTNFGTLTVNNISGCGSSANQTVCSGVAITPITFSSNVSGTVFNWTRDNTVTVTGIAASGSGSISGTLTNTTTAPVLVTFTITPVANGCSGPPITATVLVNPTPNAVAAPVSQTICSGATITTIVLSGAVGGTTYNWVRNNTATVTGIAANGTGNISGVLTNITNAPVTVTFTITPVANGCPGTPTTATVLVNPTPTVNQGSMQVIITGDGNSFADEITWTLRNSLNVVILSGGPYGFNPPPTPSAFAAAANAPFTFFIEAQGTFNDNACFWEVRCDGNLVSSGCIKGTSNPGSCVSIGTLTVNNISGCGPLLPQTICSGSAITPIVLGGPVAGTVFNWTRNNTATVTGIAASGTGTISGTLTNTTNAPILVTFTITPSANGCTGPIATTTVLVNPIPNAVAAPTAQTVCSGVPITPIVFTGNVSGTTFNWTRNNTVNVTGIAASGSGNISGTLNNITAVQQTVTFTITPVANGCTGTPITATVTVQAPLTITCPASITVPSVVGGCTAVVSYVHVVTGTPVPTVTYSFSGATTGSGSGSGSGSTFNVGVTTVTLTATNSCGTVNCSFTITVTDSQLPVISQQPSNQTVCAGSNAAFSVISTNALSYQWQAWNGSAWVNIAGATGATLTLNGVTFSMNTNSYRVIVIGLCTSVTSGFATLYVNALPTISLLASGPLVLLPAQSVTLTAVVSPGGGTYQWFKNGVAIAGATSASLVGLTVDEIGSYTARYTDLNGCVATSAAMVVSGQVSNDLFIYPVPNNGNFHIRFYNQAGEEATVRVFDMKGTLIYLKKVITTLPYTDIEVEMRIRITATEAYLVEVRGSNGRLIGAKKIIVYK